MTDPNASQGQVQKYLRVAAAHFEKCLRLLEDANEEGSEVEALEQQAAKRLYDCRKRMEL